MNNGKGWKVKKKKKNNHPKKDIMKEADTRTLHTSKLLNFFSHSHTLSYR